MQRCLYFSIHLHTLYSCGSILSAEELYKIDKTAMAEVLAKSERDEEELMKVGEEKEKEVEEAGGDELAVETGGKSGEEGKERAAAIELEEILRSCDEIQQKIGGPNKKTEDTVKDGEESESSKFVPTTLPCVFSSSLYIRMDIIYNVHVYV